MCRRVFISFLGATDYKICNYYFDGDVKDRVCNVRHVQEAIIRHECNGWTRNDRIFIFLTKEAREANWNSGKYEPNNWQKIGDIIDKLANLKVGDDKWGLKEQLDKLVKEGILPEKIVYDEPLDFEGFSEDEIWNIFNTIESKIEENDEVYFDFTNGFRNLPMLGMVLLTYLKNTKNVSIGEIYYGAFNKLGTVSHISELSLDERNAPVLKLKSFSDIMDFSSAANVFIKYGNALQLCDVIDQTWLKKENAESGGNDVILNMKKLMGPLKKKLERITTMLQSCRGLEIVNGKNVKEIRKEIQNVIGNDTEKNGPKQALNPILNIILQKFKDFDESKNLKNGIIAARWCYDNGMIQQCTTIMQETLVSICMEMLGDGYKITDRNSREDMGKILAALSGEAVALSVDEAVRKEKLEKLFSKDKFSIYATLKNLRNDINHAGFLLDVNQIEKNNTGRSGIKLKTKLYNLFSDPEKHEMFEGFKQRCDVLKKDEKLKLILDRFGNELVSNSSQISEMDKDEILDAYETMYRNYEFIENRLKQLELGDEILNRPAGMIDNETKKILEKIEEYLRSEND